MEIVYKYRDFENEFHQLMLIKNQIYFASPDTFNDPFDCGINDNFACLTEEDIKCYIDDQIEFLKEEKKVNKSNEVSIRENIRKEFEQKEKLQKIHDEMYNNNIGIFSCCQDKEAKKGWQNILMWSHYANDHKGFCVGFYTERLSNEIQDLLPNQMLKGGLIEVFKGGFVDYKEEFPLLKPLVPINKNKKEIVENYIIGLKTKAKNWEYENEYRLVRIKLDPNEPVLKNRKVNLTVDCIAEVTLGLKISKSHEKQITEICRKKNIPLYKAIKSLLKFSIDRERLIV